MVRDLPLADAVEQMAAFDPDWRPPDPAARKLYDLLAATGPEAAAQARDALAGPLRISLPVPGVVVDGAFNAQDRWLAVCVATHPVPRSTLWRLVAGTKRPGWTVPGRVAAL